MESLKHKTFKGTLWSAIERFSLNGIQFVIMLVMARMLTPSDYGVVAMISIFIGISNTFIDSGFSQALIRKIDRTEVDNSTVFYFNIGVGLFFYLVLFFCAPLIADFYKVSILTPITRIVGLSLIFGSFNVVQRAQYAIKIDFKTQAKASLTSAIISGIAGIGFAYFGFGLWALVIQQLVSLGITSALLWYFSNWRPIWAFSWSSFKSLFNYGSKILASGLINTLYTNIYQLVIGKIYMSADLGYYNRAYAFSSFASENMTGIIHRVTFPVLSKVQLDNSRLTDIYRRMIKVSVFLLFPLMIGLAALARPMILTLIGEKWLFSAKLIIPICLALMWYPVHSINLNLLMVKGRSDLFLRLEIIKKILGISVLIGTAPLGLYYMCWGLVFNSIVSLTINTYYTGKLINLGFFKQMWDVLPILGLSTLMGGSVWIIVTYFSAPAPLLLVSGIIIGALIYFLGAKIFKIPELSEILSLIKRGKKNEQPDNRNLASSPELE